MGRLGGGRSIRKLAAMAAVPIVGGGAGVVATASPAGAATTKTHQHTWTDVNGAQHTCTIEVSREYPYNGDDEIGRGATRTDDDLYCLAANYVGARYLDPEGREVTTSLGFGDLGGVDRRFAPIGSHFTTIHEVVFGNPLVPACATDCTVHYERSK